jgi:hypothetical protein
MKQSLVVLTLLGIATVLWAQPRHTIYDQLRKPEGAQFYHVPIALCEDYPEETTTPELIHNDMEMLKRAGINVLRISFGWDGIESTKGKFDWLFWDDYVKTAVDDYGITLIPYICYTPMWNSTGDTSNYWNHTPIDYDEFGKFVFALVSRYKDRIKSWELWNAKLTRIGAEAVRRADPGAIVVLAGLAGHVEFTRTLFRDLNISPYVDVVNCHSYYETWNGDPLETVVPYVNSLSDIIRRYGNKQSLWMAEVGYSTFRKPDGYVSDSYWATYDYEHTPRYQAVALWRTMTLLLSTEKMSAIAWYEIKDLPPGENVIGDVNNRNLGVDSVGWKPKPAEHALSFFNRFFAQKNRCIDRQTDITRMIGSDSEVHAFEMEDGSVAVVGWLKTCIKGRIGDQKPGNLKDTRSETITLTLPIKGGKTAALFDELGNQRPFKDISVHHGKTVITGLTLKGGEIAILKIAR